MTPEQPAEVAPRKGDAARARSREVIAAKRARGETHTNKGRRVDWAEIRLVFETDLTTTYRGLARRYSVNQWKLHARAKDEDWSAGRERSRVEAEAAGRRAAIAKLTRAATSQALRAAADLEGARARILAKLGVQLEPAIEGKATPADATRTIVETEETDGTTGKVTRKRAIASSLGVANPLSVAVLRQETALLKALLGMRQPSDGRVGLDDDDPSPPVVIA